MWHGCGTRSGSASRDARSKAAIHLVEHDGRLVVVDGFHGLFKAAVERRAKIDAMVMSGEDLEAFCGV